MKNLTELKIGESGIISDVSDIDDFLSSRGVNKGVTIKLVRKAPFNKDLNCVQLSDICLCIGGTFSKKIFVET